MTNYLLDTNHASWLMAQKDSLVTRADIVSMLEDFFSAVESMVLEGMNVNTPSANCGASIKSLS